MEGPNPHVIVELIGPTGSGKTTLTAALVARLRAEGVPVREAERVALGPLHDRLPRSGPLRALAVHVATLPWFVVEAVRRPRTPAYLALMAWRHGERFTFRLGCLRNATRRFGLWSRARAGDRSGTVVVVDEGLAQFVDMLAQSRRAPNPDEVDAYITHIPLPDFVFHLVTTDSTRAARMRQRQHRRVRDADNPALLKYAAHGAEAARLFAEHPLVAPRVVTVEVDEGTDTIEAATATLTDAVCLAFGRTRDTAS